MRIIVTRPEEDAGPLAAALAEHGHEAVMVPLLVIVPRDSAEIPDRPWQTVVATSANGIRALSGHAELRGLPMLTVGPQSLKAAQDAGFTTTQAHGGDVQGLAAHIIATLRPADGPILYLSGAETTGDLQGQLVAAGFDCVRTVLYDAVPAAGLGPAGALLRDGRIDAVLLYSPRSARIWKGLVEQAGLHAPAAAIHTLCLSRNVAAVFPEGWHIHIAERPDNAAMLGLLDQVAGTR